MRKFISQFITNLFATHPDNPHLRSTLSLDAMEDRYAPTPLVNLVALRTPLQGIGTSPSVVQSFNIIHIQPGEIRGFIIAGG